MRKNAFRAFKAVRKAGYRFLVDVYKRQLMKCICGFIKPTGGEITVDGKRVGKDVDFPKNMGIILSLIHI